MGREGYGNAPAMRAILLVVATLLMPTQGNSQELFGVRIGDTKAQALARQPGIEAQATDVPGESLMYADGRMTLLCNNVVFAVNERFGHSLHDYASSVAMEEARLGRGRVEVRNMRTPVGEVSGVSHTWRLPNDVEFTISAAQTSTSSMDVDRSYRRAASSCRGR